MASNDEIEPITLLNALISEGYKRLKLATDLNKRTIIKEQARTLNASLNAQAFYTALGHSLMHYFKTNDLLGLRRESLPCERHPEIYHEIMLQYTIGKPVANRLVDLAKASTYTQQQLAPETTNLTGEDLIKVIQDKSERPYSNIADVTTKLANADQFEWILGILRFI